MREASRCEADVNNGALQTLEGKRDRESHIILVQYSTHRKEIKGKTETEKGRSIQKILFSAKTREKDERRRLFAKERRKTK